MRLKPGEHLVRLAALTPANLGSAYGEATLDRPTQKEARFGLPYLPDSALKGVLAGAFGDQGEAREALFGSADRDATDTESDCFGEPGPVIFGNGELLAFPVPVVDGSPAWVFPALHLARALRLEEAASKDARLIALLRSLEESQTFSVFATPRLPRLDAAVRLEPLKDRTAWQGAASLAALLDRYTGALLSADAPRLVVSAARAGELWRFAAEHRALVQLDSKTRTVAHGALRYLELIPPGTLFLSWVSCLEGPGVDLPAILQAGAWEGLGLGWFAPSLISPESPPTAATLEPGDGPRPAKRTALMVEAHQAVERLAAVDPALQRVLRSTVRQFGGRAQFSGLEAALAFELAKAKPAHPEPSLEARAHRWLLSALLLNTSEPPAERGPSQEILTWIAADPFTPGGLEAQRSDLLTRWLWLARSCEHLLEEGEE